MGDGRRYCGFAGAVAGPNRRRGIGTVLVRHLVAALAGRGCLKVNLQVRAANTGVVPFYERLGFAVENLVSMGKRLYCRVPQSEILRPPAQIDLHED